MTNKPTYGELQLRVKEIERKTFELKISEEDLKVPADFFNTLVNSVSNGVIVYDKNFRYKFWNKFMEKLTGLRAKYVRGKNAFDLFPHLREEGIDKLLERALAGEAVQSDDTPYYITDTDKVGWVTGFYSPHVDISGNIVGVVAIVYDISDRKHAEDSLRASEERYRMLLEEAPDPIVIYDPEGKATYVNPAFSETFGWSRKELLGKRIDFVPEENWPETRAAIGRMIQGEKVQMFETKRLTKYNRILDIQLSSSLFQDIDGKPYGNMVILRNITAQKRAKMALQQTHDKLKEQTKMLDIKSKGLEDLNTSMRVLLKKREEDKANIEKYVLANVRRLIEPYLEKIKKTGLNSQQKGFFRILESNFNEIISPFTQNVSLKYFNLTSTEIQIAKQIRIGHTTKKIAALMNVSPRTVETHRKNIRSKIGLEGKKANLRSHLLCLD